jgi:xylulokinase
MLPKDYIRFRLTGVIATDPTDASGSLLFDIRRGQPSTHIMDAVGLRGDLFPTVIPSLSIAGEVTGVASKATGLPTGTPVAAGGSDQTMAAVALGLDDPARAAVAISSGGTVFKRIAEPLDPALGLHVMPHAAPDQWLAMGVVLSAGLSLDWLTRRLFATDASPQRLAALMEAAYHVEPGAEGLLFSSQLGGVRTPRVDDSVRGSLIGLGFQHGQEHVTRALVEGVCVALVQSLTSMTKADEPVRELVISGGGARFPLWRQTLSDVAELPVRVSSDLEHSALGAAFAGAMAVGADLDADLPNRVSQIVYPNPTTSSLYRALSGDLIAAERALATRKESEQMTLTSHFPHEGEATR